MDKALGMLGLAQKAGRVQIGEEPVGAAAQDAKARVILLASDAADNSRNRAAKFAALHNTPLLSLPYDKQTLGGIFGRASCAMAAVTDIRMALSLVKSLGLAEDDPIVIDLSAKSRRVGVKKHAAPKHGAGRT